MQEMKSGDIDKQAYTILLYSGLISEDKCVLEGRRVTIKT